MPDVIDEIKAMGLDIRQDSTGITLLGDEEALTPEIIACFKARLDEIRDAFAARRKRSSPPPAPAGTAKCIDCGIPSGSAERCHRCASLRVPVKPGMHRCPECGGITLHKSEPCSLCQATEIVTEVQRSRRQA